MHRYSIGVLSLLTFFAFFSSSTLIAQSAQENTGPPLILSRYGLDINKEIKQGTFLKVYAFSDESKVKGVQRINTAFSGKVMSKGNFLKISGDTLVLIHRGDFVFVNIDEIVMLKRFYTPFRKVFGTMVNVAGMYGLIVGGAVTISGAILTAQNDGFGPLIFFAGVMFGGAGYGVHRLGLMIRRNKFDLSETWYIDRHASSVN